MLAIQAAREGVALRSNASSSLSAALPDEEAVKTTTSTGPA